MRRLTIGFPLGLLSGLPLGLLSSFPLGLLFALMFFASTSAGSTAVAAAGRPAPHVMVIVEENRDRSQVIGAGDMPYLNSLARRYTNTTAWEGIGHPSLPNYLALISGSTQGVKSDVTGVAFPGVPTLGSQLSEAGIPWRAYMEGMPEAGYAGPESGEYVEKHNPFAYFPGTNGPNVVAASGFASELAEGRLPPFVWYTPNLINDGHDSTNATVDSSLKSIVTAVLASTWYREGGTIVITWDESETEPNVVATVIVSGEGSGTSFTTRGNHYGTLAGIEDAYGLPRLGNAAHAAPLPIAGATPLVGPAGAPTTGPSTNTVATQPVITNATQSNTNWREGTRLAMITNATQLNAIWREGNLPAGLSRAGKRAPVGTTFSFTLNEQARVGLTFVQRAAGRRVRGKCVAQTGRNRHKAHCKRLLTRGSLSVAGHGGVNKVAFQGSISRSKKLALGQYTLLISATNAAGQHASVQRLRFAIVK